MFFNLIILISSLAAGIITLFKLVNNFYDENITSQKINVKTRIRWGDSKKSHLGGLCFLISLLLTNLIIIIFFREFLLENYKDFIFFHQ